MIVDYKELMLELLFGKIILLVVFFSWNIKKKVSIKTLTSFNQGLGLRFRNQGFN